MINSNFFYDCIYIYIIVLQRASHIFRYNTHIEINEPSAAMAGRGERRVNKYLCIHIYVYIFKITRIIVFKFCGERKTDGNFWNAGHKSPRTEVTG